MAKGNILLIYPAYSYPRKSPPLGLAYIAASLEKAGYVAVIRDFNVSPMGEDDFVNLLKGHEWLFVGISFMTSQFPEAKRLSEVIKVTLPKVILVAGGPHASSIPERTLREISVIDAIAVGEGEATAVDLARCCEAGDDLECVAGLCIRREGVIICSSERPLISNLDSIPFPAWSLLPVERYSVFSIAGHSGVPAFALLSSRGCPGQCIFCDSHAVFQRKFRMRSARNIVEEIMWLNKKFGMTVFDFVDDLITLSKSRVLEFCKLVGETGVPFKWMANARVNTVDREMLSAMKAAGCIRVDFGVESGDPVVRTTMRKNVTNEQIRQSHLLSREIGLSTGSFTMVGNLGETRQSVEMTISLLKDIGDDVMVSIACPYPGTELYRLGKEKGFINTEEWGCYVTSPTYIDNFRPVMRTDVMSEEQILNSYYHLNAVFAGRKFRRRYGKFFYINPRFYADWVFNPCGFRRRVGMASRLFMSCMREVAGKGEGC